MPDKTRQELLDLLTEITNLPAAGKTSDPRIAIIPMAKVTALAFMAAQIRESLRRQG